MYAYQDLCKIKNIMDHTKFVKFINLYRKFYITIKYYVIFHRLYFMSWVPGRVVKTVHRVPLFQTEERDYFVDNNITISMAQWKHNTRVLVVYGTAYVFLIIIHVYIVTFAVSWLIELYLK